MILSQVLLGGPKKGRLIFQIFLNSTKRIQILHRNLVNLLLFGLLGQEHSLDVGQDTTLSNSNTSQKFVQFFIISDGQLQVSGDDSGFLVISGSVTSQFQDFSGQVFQNGSQVDWGTSTDSFSVVTLSEQSVDSANGELETSSRRSGLRFSFGFSSAFTFSGHFEVFWLFFGFC